MSSTTPIVIVENGKAKNKDTNVFKVFVGYDPREDIAYEVCKYSILKRSSIPVEVIPIKQPELRESGLYWRDRNALESTQFSFTRFLTPHLANYNGWAMFVDCDFLYLDDIKKLVSIIDDRYAVMCVQHDYTPKESTKMDGVVQTVYPRKNWSSMVLYNCGHPKNKVLTPEIVNTETGAFLHRFSWLEDHEIGAVPFVWNFLVGHNEVDVNDPSTMPKAIHYTSGGPWFEAYRNCDFADLWVNEMEEYKNGLSKKDHVKLWAMLSKASPRHACASPGLFIHNHRLASVFCSALESLLLQPASAPPCPPPRLCPAFALETILQTRASIGKTDMICIAPQFLLKLLLSSPAWLPRFCRKRRTRQQQSSRILGP